MVRSFFAILFLLSSAGTLLFVAGRAYVKDENRKKAEARLAALAWNRTLADTAVQQLQHADVVLRMGNGVFSHMLASFNRRDKSWSHSGIVLVEHGYPFVYHCAGSENDSMPCVRRDSAHHFFSPVYNMGAAVVRYQLPDSVKERMAAIVHAYRRSRPVFDTRFDLRTDSALYCTEFVWKTITRAIGDSTWLPTSVAGSRQFAGTDDLFLNPHASMVWQVQYK